MGKTGKNKMPFFNLDEQICNANMNIEDAFDTESFAIADEDILMMPEDSNDLLPLLELLDIDTVELDRIEAEQRMEAENEEAVDKKNRQENETRTIEPMVPQERNNGEIRNTFQSNESDTTEMIKKGNSESSITPEYSIYTDEALDIDAMTAEAVVAQVFASESVAAKVFAAVELDAEVAAADEWVTKALAAENLANGVSTIQLKTKHDPSKHDEFHSASIVPSTIEEPEFNVTSLPNDNKPLQNNNKAKKLTELSTIKTTEFNSPKLTSIEKVVSKDTTERDLLDMISSDVSLSHMRSSDVFENYNDVIRKPVHALKSIQLMKSAMKADSSVGKCYAFKSLRKINSMKNIETLFPTNVANKVAGIKKMDGKTFISLGTSDVEEVFRPANKLYKSDTLKKGALLESDAHGVASSKSLHLLENMISSDNMENSHKRTKNLGETVVVEKRNSARNLELLVRRDSDIHKPNSTNTDPEIIQGKTSSDDVNSIHSVNYKATLASNLSSLQQVTPKTSEIEDIKLIKSNEDVLKTQKILHPDSILQGLVFPFSNIHSKTTASNLDLTTTRSGFTEKKDVVEIAEGINSFALITPENIQHLNSIIHTSKGSTAIMKKTPTQPNAEEFKEVSGNSKESSSSAPQKEVGLTNIEYAEPVESAVKIINPNKFELEYVELNPNHNEKKVVRLDVTQQEKPCLVIQSPRIIEKNLSVMDKNYKRIETVVSSDVKILDTKIIKPIDNNEQTEPKKSVVTNHFNLMSAVAKSKGVDKVILEGENVIKLVTTEQSNITKKNAPYYFQSITRNQNETRKIKLMENNFHGRENNIIKLFTNDTHASTSKILGEPRDKIVATVNLNLTSVQVEFSETKGIDIEHNMVKKSVSIEQDSKKIFDIQNNVDKQRTLPIGPYKKVNNKMTSLSQLTTDNTSGNVNMRNSVLSEIQPVKKKYTQSMRPERDGEKAGSVFCHVLPKKTEMMNDPNVLISSADLSEANSVDTNEKNIQKYIQQHQDVISASHVISRNFQPTLKKEVAVTKNIVGSLEIKKLPYKGTTNIKSTAIKNVKLVEAKFSLEREKNRIDMTTNSVPTEDSKPLRIFPSCINFVPQKGASMLKYDACEIDSASIGSKSETINQESVFKGAQSSVKPVDPQNSAPIKGLELMETNARIADIKNNMIDSTSYAGIKFVPQKGASMKTWNLKLDADKKKSKGNKVVEEVNKLPQKKKNDTIMSALSSGITFVPQKGAYIKEWDLKLKNYNATNTTKGVRGIKSVTPKPKSIKTEKSDLFRNASTPLLNVVPQKGNAMKKWNLFQRDVLTSSEMSRNVNNSKLDSAHLTQKSVIVNNKIPQLDNEIKISLDTDSGSALNKQSFVKPSFLPLLTPNGYRCLCNRQFKDRTSLRTHVVDIHERQDKRLRSFKCNLCTKRYFSMKNLKSHFLVIHKNLKKFICNSCGKKFETKTKLRVHINCKHAKIRECKCTICFKPFLTEKHVIRHINSVHYNIKQFSCPTCNNEFNSNTHLRSHIKIVHEKSRNFHCDQCEAKFSTNSNLRRHVRVVHENIRGHTCKVCLKEFISTSHLNRHFNIMHKHFRLFKCSECGLSKTTKSNLQRHLRIHSKLNKPPTQLLNSSRVMS